MVIAVWVYDAFRCHLSFLPFMCYNIYLEGVYIMESGMHNEAVLTLRCRGYSYSQIAAECGLSKTHVARICKQHGGGALSLTTLTMNV